MNIIKRHLPSNCYSSRLMSSVDGIVKHFISAVNILPDDPFNLDAIIQIFIDYKVSAKYLIDRDGTIYELVPGLYRAYHAGYSRMNDRDRCNDFTIGIEYVGGTDFPYTDAQIAAGAWLTRKLMDEYGFTIQWVQGHERVRADWIAAYPNKAKAKNVPSKSDPGEHFPWMRLLAELGGA